MEVKVTLHGILRDHLPRPARGRTILSLPSGATIADVLQQLEINRKVNAAVDGTQVEISYTLQNGDDLHLFRPLGGG